MTRQGVEFAVEAGVGVGPASVRALLAIAGFVLLVHGAGLALTLGRFAFELGPGL